MHGDNSVWEYGVAIGILAVFFIPILFLLIRKLTDAAFNAKEATATLKAHRENLEKKLAEIEADQQKIVQAMFEVTVSLKEMIALNTFLVKHYINGKEVKNG